MEAAAPYREAAEAGSRNGAFNLGLLLAREGSEPEAAVWWTRAAAGHGRAALRLALVYARRGELAEGQRWADRAVALGPAEVSERAVRVAGRAAGRTVRLRGWRVRSYGGAGPSWLVARPRGGAAH
ncbi:hypothetical protein STENM327S_01902 [Streptomyces tendae]